MILSDAQVDRVAKALGGAPHAAYTTPIVYPWSVQNFQPRPRAERLLPASDTLRLYTHIPFCNYHCTFCFYAVRAGAQRPEMERYVEALRRELELIEPGTKLAQLTVGGGTPTALPPELLDAVLGAIFARTAAHDGAMHTLEASPDSLSDAHLRVLHDRGIGRVSIGVESMDGEVLGVVRRRHSPDEALAACRRVSESGLTLNIDLIYGLPGQTEDDFRRDLELVAAAGAQTLCLYALRVNERTTVSGQLDEGERLNLARLMRWREFVTRAAAEVGYAQTRGYTYKRAGDQRAWHEREKPEGAGGVRFELGIGMSARSQLGDVVYRNHDRSDVYVDRIERGESPVESVFELDAADRKTQFVAVTLGNSKPLERAAYAKTFGAPIESDFDATLDVLREAGLIDDDGARLTLSDTGKLVYDRILLCFYPQRAAGWLRDRAANRRR